MQVRIIRKEFGGVEFSPEMRVLHLGGQSSANVERLTFELPEEWQGLSVTLHIQRQDGTLPTPILLDEDDSCAVGKEFTASACGSWMLLALGEDGYRALTRPARYECYETLNTDGDAEISPTQYETFVARVLSYANSAQSGAQEARNARDAAQGYAEQAQAAQAETAKAADRAAQALGETEGHADRAEAAAKRAEGYAPKDGTILSVNGKGGAVVLDAEDVGAVPEGSAGYVKSFSLMGRVITLTLGDGSVLTMQTQDTTTLENMAGILSVEHGGTGKKTALTAQDVGAVKAGSGDYVQSVTAENGTLSVRFGDGTSTRYALPIATADTPGVIKAGKGMTVGPDGTATIDAYSKAEMDTKMRGLQTKVEKAGAVGQTIVVWSYCAGWDGNKLYTVAIPDTVDFLVVKTAMNVLDPQTAIPRGKDGAVEEFTFTFKENGELDLYNHGSGYGAPLYLVGYHYLTADDGVKVPYIVEAKKVNVSSNAGVTTSFAVDSTVDYITTEWTTSGSATTGSGGSVTVTNKYSGIVARESVSDSWDRFLDDGTVKISSKSGTCYVTMYRYMTPAELSAQS